MAQLKVGGKAPAFTLEDQDGKTVKLSDFTGKKVVVYFYPKADTPGCTQQSCNLRDAMRDLKKLEAVVLGISPDTPAKQKKFDDKYGLGLPAPRRRGPRRRREVRRVGREVDLRQEVHGHRALGLRHRRDGQAHRRLLQGVAGGHGAGGDETALTKGRTMKGSASTFSSK